MIELVWATWGTVLQGLAVSATPHLECRDFTVIARSYSTHSSVDSPSWIRLGSTISCDFPSSSGAAEEETEEELAKRERMRDRVIKEIIDTEKFYIKSIGGAIDVSYFVRCYSLALQLDFFFVNTCSILWHH